MAKIVKSCKREDVSASFFITNSVVGIFVFGLHCSLLVSGLLLLSALFDGKGEKS